MLIKGCLKIYYVNKGLFEEIDILINKTPSST